MSRQPPLPPLPPPPPHAQRTALALRIRRWSEAGGEGSGTAAGGGSGGYVLTEVESFSRAEFAVGTWIQQPRVSGKSSYPVLTESLTLKSKLLDVLTREISAIRAKIPAREWFLPTPNKRGGRVDPTSSWQ